jgi:isopentenyl diphosphate isomerase/L-lactate dehydrogenase-like FMN-dependent dehydrogenase
MAGRPTLFGTATAGKAGGEKALSIMHREFEKTMAYVGCRTLAEVSPDVLAYPPARAGRRPLAAE